MSDLAIEALRAEHLLALDLARSLTADEWTRPSDCAGWRVQDVYAHMAATARTIVDPASVATVESDDAELKADVAVVERRERTATDVFDEYAEWCPKMITALAALQSEPTASTVVPLGNLGSHPLHILANAIVFDHYCHLRHDLLAPAGPIQRPPLPSDELRLRPTVEWMIAGLPQMCADALRIVDRPITLILDGPGGGTWTLMPGDSTPGLTGPVRIVTGKDPAAVADAVSSSHDFVSWGTRRRDWRATTRVTGAIAYASCVLDAFNVI